ncbi:hypothetical protein R6Z07M_001978 [Ovis aries]
MNAERRGAGRGAGGLQEDPDSPATCSAEGAPRSRMGRCGPRVGRGEGSGAAWRARRPSRRDRLRRAPRRGEPVLQPGRGANLRPPAGLGGGAARGGLCPDFLLRWHSATVTPGGPPRTPPKAQPNSEPREEAAGCRRRGARAGGPGEVRGRAGGARGRAAPPARPAGAHTYPRARGSRLRRPSRRAPLAARCAPGPAGARGEGAGSGGGGGGGEGSGAPRGRAAAEAPPPGGEPGGSRGGGGGGARVRRAPGAACPARGCGWMRARAAAGSRGGRPAIQTSPRDPRAGRLVGGRPATGVPEVLLPRAAGPGGAAGGRGGEGAPGPGPRGARSPSLGVWTRAHTCPDRLRLKDRLRARRGTPFGKRKGDSGSAPGARGDPLCAPGSRLGRAAPGGEREGPVGRPRASGSASVPARAPAGGGEGGAGSLRQLLQPEPPGAGVLNLEPGVGKRRRLACRALAGGRQVGPDRLPGRTRAGRGVGLGAAGRAALSGSRGRTGTACGPRRVSPRGPGPGAEASAGRSAAQAPGPAGRGFAQPRGRGRAGRRLLRAVTGACWDPGDPLGWRPGRPQKPRRGARGSC